MNKLILVLALLCSGAYAGDIEDIMANYGKTDYATAITTLKKAAAQGDAQAQNSLGLMYASGQGVTQDYAEAAKWYKLSVAQGNAQAENNLRILDVKEAEVNLRIPRHSPPPSPP